MAAHNFQWELEKEGVVAVNAGGGFGVWSAAEYVVDRVIVGVSVSAVGTDHTAENVWSVEGVADQDG